jgi:hypothetical protein
MKRVANLFLLSLVLVIGLQPVFATNFDVLAGSDYFVTQPGTSFQGVAFNGVPTGPGNSDTIVQRTQQVNLGTGAPSSGTTSLLMIQLELVSAAPTNVFGPLGFYYITLQSNRSAAEGGPGPSSTGSMTINLNSNDDHTSANPEGTFTSSLDVFFDIRSGSATGAIVASSNLSLSNAGGVWDADPAPNDIIVSGLKGDLTKNLHTNKIQNVDINDMDFFPVGNITESAGSDTHVVNVQMPEPGTTALLGGALLLLWPLRRRA